VLHDFLASGIRAQHMLDHHGLAATVPKPQQDHDKRALHAGREFMLWPAVTSWLSVLAGFHMSVVEKLPAAGQGCTCAGADGTQLDRYDLI
jgi:hypothetical protein